MAKDGGLIFAAKPRRRHAYLWLTVLLLFGWVSPRLAAALPAAVQQANLALSAHFVPQYEDRLDSLQAENATLHRQLAEAQTALAENEALRQWVGIFRPAGSWRTARVVRRGWNRAALAGTAPVGASVCDARGRFAGRITASGADQCTLTFAGSLSPAAAGFAGAYAGLLQSGWRLTGLPLNTGLCAGTVALTTDGLWLGQLAEAPVPTDDGLTSQAALRDTADLNSTVFFIKM